MKCISRWFSLVALTGALGFGGVPVRAQTETVLYTFSGGADGGFPDTNLIRDKQGNLYGTTYFGGTADYGVVFKLTPHYGQNNETVLYNFSGGSDGRGPNTGLIMDKEGNLYGTTYGGGAYNRGLVYKLSPPYGQNNETVLYNFTGGADGYGPLVGVIMDKQGNLYGTTFLGGASGAGVVFKLSPPFGQNSETVLYSFSGGVDGAAPSAVIMDKAHNLYGTTELGGNLNVNDGLGPGVGVVFKLSPPSSGATPWNETILYTFSDVDGAYPSSYLIRDKQGNLYGTTGRGGVSTWGVVYKLSPPYGQNNETVLYSFTGEADGRNPVAGVIMDKQGNLYGTTQQGGNISLNGGNGWGVVFMLSPPFSGTGTWNESVLYTFTGGADGADPNEGSLIMDKKGNLYGTASHAGTSNSGVVYEIKRKK